MADFMKDTNDAVLTLVKACNSMGSGSMKIVLSDDDDEPLAIVYVAPRQFAGSSEALNELNNMLEEWEEKWGEE